MHKCSRNRTNSVFALNFCRFAKIPPKLFEHKVVRKLHFVNYKFLLDERLPKPEFLTSTTTMWLAIRLKLAHVHKKHDDFEFRAAVPNTRVQEIQRFLISAGCTLHTCSNNTTISRLALICFAFLPKYHTSSLRKKLSESDFLSITILY